MYASISLNINYPLVFFKLSLFFIHYIGVDLVFEKLKRQIANLFINEINI